MSNSETFPPSALYVEYILSIRGGTVSRQTLLEETGLHESTLKDALRTLREANRIRQASSCLDARESYYVLETESG